MAGVSDTAEMISTTETEISALKETYGDDCRVIKNIGDFAYVVKITFKEWGCNIKFQLTSGYPSDRPEVVVNGNEETIAFDLQIFLRSILRQKSVSELVDMASRWLEQHGVQADTVLCESPKNNYNKKKKIKKVQDETEKEAVAKKSSMKTAEDVVKRILWDTNLQSDEFIIGYLDRFIGVVEKGFIHFSWEDLASVDYTVLAIPKHRIQYFKYKSVKVWDKNERLDNVFGSTGSGLTITDVIQSYTESHPTALASTQSSFSEEPSATNEPTKSSATLSFTVNDDSDDDSSDDDDGVTITLGSSGVCVPSNLDEDVEEDFQKDLPWQNKMRPNYFLCQRITNPEILESVAHMQDLILDRSSGYDTCIMPPVALHVTLCTLGLDTPELIQDAVRLLQRSRDELKEMLRDGITLECSGVGNFFGRVVYGKIKHGKDFSEYVEHLRALVREAGLDIRDGHDFVPHMTIMKVTRPVARQTGRKTVPSWMYDEFKDVNFGKQSIDGIYLCQMKPEKGSDGFYVSPGNISFKDDEPV